MVKLKSSSKLILLTILPPFWPKLPPIGIGYLQSYLLKNNINCGILDLNNIFYNLAPPELKKSWLISCNTSLEENILSIIENAHPKEYEDTLQKMLKYGIIGFSCFKSNFQNSLKLIKILKSKNKNIKIILGGPEIARQYFKTSGKFFKEIKDLADFIVAGEGEKPLFDYATKATDGLAGENLRYFCELPNLTTLPFPIYKGINLSSYPRKNAISILLSRGCPKKCGFCSERLLYKKFRIRPVENVIEEIKFHIANNKIGYFIFNDSLLNADLKKLEELCDKLTLLTLSSTTCSCKACFAILGHTTKQAHKLRQEQKRMKGWEAQIAIRNDMSPKLLSKMKKSGCYNLFIGIESGCNKTLKNMNKGFTTKDALEFFKKLQDAGLFFGISIIVGYPGETEKNFEESLNFVLKNKPLIPKIEQINPYIYYNGTHHPHFGSGVYPTPEVGVVSERMDIFVSAIKSAGFKYTNAFIGNLIEKPRRLPLSP